MVVPATPAFHPQPQGAAAKRDAETLAWFGTAYGRREAKDKPSPLPANAAGPGIQAGKANEPLNTQKRRYAPLILLFTVLTALLLLRWMPLAPQPAAVPEPMSVPHRFEADPAIEANRQDPAAGLNVPASAVPLTVVGDPTAGIASGAPATTQKEPEQTNVQTHALAGEPQPANLEFTRSNLATAALPPAIALAAASAPDAEARLVASPDLARVSEPQPVKMSDARLPALLPSMATKAKYPKSAFQPPPPLNRPSKTQTHSDLALGKALFERGDLLAARAAFEKAFERGLPEAALAIGNTFDPVSLAKAGVTEKGDPAAARRWYRRAFELAMRRPERRSRP